MTTTPLIYLDNASTSFPKAPHVGDAMSAALATGGATPGRGGHAMVLEATRRTDRLRQCLAGLIGATEPQRMVLTSGSTESINIAIAGLLTFDPNAPLHVVTTVIEHNSVARPLAAWSESGWVVVNHVPCDATGVVDAHAVLHAVDDRTDLVIMTHASNVTGAIQPVGDIGRGLRNRGRAPLFLVDGAQSVGVLEIDVDAMGIDMLAFSGHKGLLGPAGTGALYVGPRAFTGDGPLQPTRFGGTGGVASHSSRSLQMPLTLPGRFEAGTPNTIGQAGLLQAVEHLPDGALAHERRLLARIVDLAERNERVQVVGPTSVEDRVGVLSVVIEGMAPEDVGLILETSFGIAVRPGLQCAPGCHRALGTLDGGGTIRISPGPWTSEEDFDRFVHALEELLV